MNLDNSKKPTLYGVPVSLIIVLHLLSLIYISKIKYVNLIGAASVLLVVILSFLYIIKNASKVKLNRSWLVAVVYIVYNLIWMFIEPTSNGLYLWGQQTALLFYAISLSSIAISENSFFRIGKVFSKLYVVILILNLTLILFGQEKIILSYFSGTVYKAIFALSFFALSYSKHKIPLVILSIIMFVGLGERTSAIVLVVILMIYLLLGLLRKSKILYSSFYWVYVAVLVTFPQFYVWLSNQYFAVELNNLSIALFGERFFSGRNVIWEYALNAMKGEELFGLGISNNFISELSYLSVHNLYVFLLLQGGYVLIALISVFLFLFWKKAYNYIDNHIVRLSSAYMLGIMLLLEFDLILLANNFVVSMYLWLVIGLSQMMSNKLRDKSKFE